MSVRRSSPSEQLRISPHTAPKAAAGGWHNIPHINQLRPNGADQGYVNGAYNCGPAVVAMLARGWGRMGNLNDAQLINQLGKGIVTKNGTDAEGMMQMLKRADVPLAGAALGAGFDKKALDQHLDKGHKVIAQVQVQERSADAKKVDDDAHYVLIQGKTKDGNYNVSDPLANKSYVVTPQQLKKAVLKAPPDGGMLIPISSPAEGKRAATPPPPAEAKAPKMAASRMVSRMMMNGYEGGPLKAARKPEAKAPNPNAFKTTQQTFKGVDTRYQDSSSVQSNPEMEQNEQRNQGEKLDVRYSKSKGARNQPVARVIGDHKDEETAAQELRERKKSKDMDVFKLLAQLEKSVSEKDKKVLEKVKEADKKDPGIGKRMTPDGF